MKSSIEAACATHPTADVFINFASFRSAAASSMSALKQPTIRVVAIIAEVVPESDTKQPIAYVRSNNKVSCDEHKDLCEDNNVTGYPTILCSPNNSLEAKRYNGIRTLEAFAEFINAEGGTNIKVPVNPSHVVEVTAESFDEVIFDITKHVLVEFYAPWCGHSNNFVPTYEDVASVFKLDEEVVIARVNIDENEEISERFSLFAFN